jgi:hypothetical protein
VDQDRDESHQENRWPKGPDHVPETDNRPIDEQVDRNDENDAEEEGATLCFPSQEPEQVDDREQNTKRHYPDREQQSHVSFPRSTHLANGNGCLVRAQ